MTLSPKVSIIKTKNYGHYACRREVEVIVFFKAKPLYNTVVETQTFTNGENTWLTGVVVRAWSDGSW